MKRKLIVLTLVVVLIVFGIVFLLNTNWVAINSHNQLPSDLQKLLIGAPQFELLALDPIRQRSGNVTNKDTLLNYPSLGRAKIENQVVRQAIVHTFSRDIASSHHPHTACILEPRHGIHCAAGTNTVNIAICFRCGDVLLEQNGKEQYLSIKSDWLFKPVSERFFGKLLLEAVLKK